MGRPALVLVPLLAVLALAGPAGAASAPEGEDAAIERAREWRGRWCPPTGCGAPPRASFASVGGFAVATLGALALARRRAS